jgi:hypothetical protein
MNEVWIADLGRSLPDHAAVVAKLAAAVEYDTGVQLDITTWRRPWRRTRVTDIPIVDKDGDLAMLDEPPANVIEDRLRREAREWVMLAWWAVSDVAKYLQRGSLFEAADRITAARDWALRLFAAANRIPDAGYGLSSLLDHEPHALPAQLAETYCLPPDPDAVASAARAVVALLHDCADRAQATIGVDLTTPWSATAARRLEATGAAPP